MDVEFDLVFEHGGMRRIIAYIYHPSTICFEDLGGARSCSVQIEAASNFILWLLGKPHDPIAVQKLLTERVFDGHKAAPISEMRRYMALEKREQKVLDEAGYHRAFLSWAKDYLGRDFDIALESNRSIAAACASKMNEMAWTARIKNYLAEEKRAQKTESDTEHQYLTKRAMHSRNTKGSEQKVGGPALDAEDDSSDSMDRRRQPSSVLTTSEFRYMQGQINRSIVENRKYHPRGEIRDLWDGHEVKVYSNGTIPLWVPWREKPLHWYISPEARKSIEHNQTSPTIHFFPEKVSLKVRDESVFSRSKTFMQNAQDGKDWNCQIKKELGAKGYLNLFLEPKDLSSSGDDGDVYETHHSRRAGPNADRRMRLLEGSEFHCGERKEDKYGRLQQAIAENSNDYSPFAWKFLSSKVVQTRRQLTNYLGQSGQPLAPSVRSFLGANTMDFVCER